MRSERAQATVEHVGIVLGVAALLGVFGGALVRAGVAGSLATGIARAFGLTDGSQSASVDVPPVLAAMFARATDPSTPNDARPSLNDVRLQLDDQLGVAAGDDAYRALVLGEVRELIPEADGGDHRYLFVGRRSIFGFDPPIAGAPYVVEHPIAALSIHVVRPDESDALLAHALSRHRSGFAIVGDVLALVPFGPTRAVTIALQVAQSVSGIASLVDDIDRYGQHVAGLPPGTRQDDIVVAWPIDRTVHPLHGPIDVWSQQAANDGLVRLAVIRNGQLVEQAIAIRHP